LTLADASLQGVSLGGALGFANASLRGASLNDTMLLAEASLLSQFERSSVKARRLIPSEQHLGACRLLSARHLAERHHSAGRRLSTLQV
jgi:uncharacterized protein YjbI with pentapeptide repeats